MRDDLPAHLELTSHRHATLVPAGAAIHVGGRTITIAEGQALMGDRLTHLPTPHGLIPIPKIMRDVDDALRHANECTALAREVDAAISRPTTGIEGLALRPDLAADLYDQATFWREAAATIMPTELADEWRRQHPQGGLVTTTGLHHQEDDDA